MIWLGKYSMAFIMPFHVHLSEIHPLNVSSKRWQIQSQTIPKLWILQTQNLQKNANSIPNLIMVHGFLYPFSSCLQALLLPQNTICFGLVALVRCCLSWGASSDVSSATIFAELLALPNEPEQNISLPIYWLWNRCASGVSEISHVAKNNFPKLDKKLKYSKLT